ncbi:hypothetical protein LY76DRAFT_229995 [Colletotrichum caudatum]|nr:hypothetical protein LY76DRAFT_229995 [Colletotrichum caudatum]
MTRRKSHLPFPFPDVASPWSAPFCQSWMMMHQRATRDGTEQQPRQCDKGGSRMDLWFSFFTFSFLFFHFCFSLSLSLSLSIELRDGNKITYILNIPWGGSVCLGIKEGGGLRGPWIKSKVCPWMFQCFF